MVFPEITYQRQQSLTPLAWELNSDVTFLKIRIGHSVKECFGFAVAYYVMLVPKRLKFKSEIGPLQNPISNKHINKRKKTPLTLKIYVLIKNDVRAFIKILFLQ